MNNLKGGPSQSAYTHGTMAAAAQATFQDILQSAFGPVHLQTQNTSSQHCCANTLCGMAS